MAFLDPLRHRVHWLRAAFRELMTLLDGVREYRRSGTTPQAAYYSLVTLYCMTRGASNDLFHRAVALARPKESFPAARGVLGALDRGQVAGIAGALREQGYYRFPTLVPADLCDRLVAVARRSPARPFPLKPGDPALAVYDPARPLSANYRFDESVTVTIPDVQALMTDFSLLSVAQAYLGCSPVLDIVAFWWSARFGDVPDATAAQLYHFDMDRVKWIKFFFYLTDVTPGSGPHCFVAGSHRRFAQPRELLRHGYARIGDDEVARHYPRDRMLELTGPRGSIFAVDTRGFHKGKPPQTADRLLLQLEFSDCLFGAEYDRTPWPLPAGAAARDAVTRFPRVYAKFPLAEPRAAEKAA